MPRRSTDEPISPRSAPGAGPEANVGVRSEALVVPAPKSNRSLLGSIRGLSSKVRVEDMVRLHADRAQHEARAQALADGRDAEAARKAGKRARAEAIKASAAKAGVSPITARRWARGAQRASPRVEKQARAKLQRSMGGARGVRAAQISAIRYLDVGKVKVTIDTDKRPTPGERDIGGVALSESKAAEIARLYEQGDEAKAAETLERAILEEYGKEKGSSMSFMRIDQVLDAVTYK